MVTWVHPTKSNYCALSCCSLGVCKGGHLSQPSFVAEPAVYTYCCIGVRLARPDMVISTSRGPVRWPCAGVGGGSRQKN